MSEEVLTWIGLGADGVVAAAVHEAEPVVCVTFADEAALERALCGDVRVRCRAELDVDFQLPENFRDAQRLFVNDQRDKVLATYRQSLESSEFSAQDAACDAQRFSRMHSWYKHLGEFEVAFPLLLPGQEWRNGICAQIEPSERRLHWRFIFEDGLARHAVVIGPVCYSGVPDALRREMARFPIYLSREFGQGGAHAFQLVACREVARRFFRHVTRTEEEQTACGTTSRRKKSPSHRP
jgi:hypothetical protein